MHRHWQSGITLIEMACALAVLSIVAGIAAPSMQKWRQRAAADSLLAALTTDIAYARMSAISRGEHMVVCPSLDTAHCHPAAAWNVGWIVFADPNRDRVHQADEEILSVSQARKTPGLTFSSTSGRRSIRLFPSGMGYGSNLTATACLSGKVHARLIMNNSGRVRTERPKAPKSCTASP